jgi:hypothetical protein
VELLNNLALGLATALTLKNLLYCFAGTLIGTLIGVLPGLGPVATLAMLLPFTYALEPTSALISEPEASTTAPIRPSTISEKYSAGPNLRANSDSGIATVATITVATVPAKNDARAAVASAAREHIAALGSAGKAG